VENKESVEVCVGHKGEEDNGTITVTHDQLENKSGKKGGGSEG
jgi:hypothetical protein